MIAETLIAQSVLKAKLPSQEQRPTMYDLPSEDPQEPGLPDIFHYFQPHLLQDTFVPPHYLPEQIFAVGDLNLYYDLHHPLWHKRPDWFAVLGVARLYQQQDLRLSYVVWDEKVIPFIVVELLSPGTEKEDLGQTIRDVNQPPVKWEVYEQILQVPYYVVFDRYTEVLRVFKWVEGRYQSLRLEDNWVWLPEVELGLGLWLGEDEGLHRHWLRWSDKQRHWILTPVEREWQRAEQEKQRAERLAAQLRALGIEPE
jgi:Uma2 family endonuclease